MPSLNCRITFNIENVRIAELRKVCDMALKEGVKGAAKILLRDCRPYIPMLTGKLRDSGRISQLEYYAFQLIWDAANLKYGYVYAKKQYEEVLQHVDGKYAAKWIHRVLEANPGRYSYIATRLAEMELKRKFGGTQK